MATHSFQNVVNQLMQLNKAQQYLTYDDIMDVCDSCGVALTQTEKILRELTDQGCRIFENPPTDQELAIPDDSSDAFESFDYAQTDYEKLYDEVLKADPGLEMIIQYARTIRPAQHGEAAYIFENSSQSSDGKKRLFDMNFRAVIKVAFQQYQQYDEELADLIQLGAIGLLIAIGKYDVASGSPFASYANSWIFQSISRGTMYRKNGCYFPAHFSDTMKEIERMVDRHSCRKCGGTKLYCPNLIEEIEKQYSINTTMAERLLLFTQPIMSYELIADDEDDDNRLGDILYKRMRAQGLITALDENPTYEKYCKIEIRTRIENILLQLSQREREVLRYRFGFYDGHEWTLEEVGGVYGITRERIRQIETKAIRRMRHPSKSRQISDFWF